VWEALFEGGRGGGQGREEGGRRDFHAWEGKGGKGRLEDRIIK